MDRLNATDQAACELALGRIFRICSRPEQPGDVKEYERCRKIIMDVSREAKKRTYSHQYTRG